MAGRKGTHGQSAGLALIGLQMNNPDLFILVGQFIQNCTGIVRAAIIDKQDFIFVIALQHEPANGFPDIFSLIVARHDNGNTGVGLQLGRLLYSVAKGFFPAQVIDYGPGHPDIGHKERIIIGEAEKHAHQVLNPGHWSRPPSINLVPFVMTWLSSDALG